jgi:hypothetical protein
MLDLGKYPDQVFEDFIERVIQHIVLNASRTYHNRFSNCRVELVLAFPSGWSDSIHTTVAEAGARAMSKAIQNLSLQNIQFGIEDVFTVSETLCGVKQWLGESIPETAESRDDHEESINLGEINVSILSVTM